jgi:thiol:disulfide interchange protein DsbD
MLSLLAVLIAAQPSYASAQLVADVSAVQPGVPFVAAIVIKTEPDWHVYWKNPGDAGMPTAIEWKLPEGWKAEPLEYPTPKTFESGGIVGYGYEGEALFLTRITPPKNVKTAPLKASVRWLVCNEACMPGSAAVNLTLPVASTPKPSATWAKRVQKAEQELPKPAQGWTFAASKTADGYVLNAQPPSGVSVEGDPEFLPFDPALIAHDAPQGANVADGKITLKLKKSPFATETPKTLKGLLLAPAGQRWPNGLAAIVIEAPIASGG